MSLLQSLKASSRISDASLPNADQPISEEGHQSSDCASPRIAGVPGIEDASVSKRSISGIREVLFIVVICCSNIVTQASLGMTIVPLDLISESFGPLNPGQKSWFVAAFSLTLGTFILIAGRLGDIYGHKLLFVSGYFWYAVWSMIAGLSVYTHSQIFFDICRALQGIGPAMMIPSSLALLGTAYGSGRRKEMVFSIYGATAPNGFVCGAVFGSLLARFVAWPWEFYVMAFACAGLGAMAIFIIPGYDRIEQQQKSHFDWLGTFTGVAGLVLFNTAWNQAPIAGWNSPYVIVFLILGCCSISTFFVVEARTEHALIPKGILTGKAGFVLACIALGWSSFGIWIYYLYLFLHNLRHVTPLLSAAQMVPAGISGACAAIGVGYLLSRIPTSMIMVIAMSAFCIGNVLVATMPVSQTYWLQTFLAVLITPWGMDMSFPAATIILSDLVPKEQQGIAASLVATVVNYSISLGLGIAGTVEVHVNHQGLDLMQGYRGAFYAAISLSGIGCLLALSFALRDLFTRNRCKH